MHSWALITSLVVSPKVPKWLFQENRNHIEEIRRIKRLLKKSINRTGIFIVLDYLKGEEGVTWRI
jgi:hypothetical protein